MGRTKLQCREMHTCACHFLDYYESQESNFSKEERRDTGRWASIHFLDSNTSIFVVYYTSLLNDTFVLMSKKKRKEKKNEVGESEPGLGYENHSRR